MSILSNASALADDDDPTAVEVVEIANTTPDLATTAMEVQEDRYYSPLLGAWLAMPEWEAALTVSVLTVIILGTVVGNVLVIISVFTHAPLKITPNYFIVSLAAADLTVSILVLPLNVMYQVLGWWPLPDVVCKAWLTFDILCCTASILNLCAIALDRYHALHNPIRHAQRRSASYVLSIIAFVWVLSFVISSPPLLGWNDWPDQFTRDTPCELTSDKGYVIYSAMGSFYIPLAIIIFTYIKIFRATRRRLRKRAQASSLGVLNRTAANNNPVGNASTPGAVSNRAVENDAVPMVEMGGGGKDAKVLMETKVTLQNQPDAGMGCQVKTSTTETAILRCELEQEDNNTNNSHNGKQQQQQQQLPLLDKAKQTNGTAANKTKQNGLTSAVKSRVSKLAMLKTLAGAEDGSIDSGVSGSSHPHHHVNMGSPGSGRNNAGAVDSNDQMYRFINEKAKISLAKERKAAKTMTIVVGTFIICWLPFFLMYVILPHCQSCQPSGKLVQFITWLGYANSTLNPIIYTIFNEDFRRAFAMIISCKLKCRQ